MSTITHAGHGYKLKWTTSKADGNMWSTKFKVPLGTIYIYLTARKNNKFDFDIVWNNLEGSDKQIFLKKNVGEPYCKDLDSAAYYALGIIRYHFETHKEYDKWLTTLDQLESIRSIF